MHVPHRPRALLLLGAAPWRRAPLLLRRHPAVAAGVAAASLVLCAAAATLPLFLGSVENAALHRQLAERCPPTVGFTYGRSFSPAAQAPPGSPTALELLPARHIEFRRAAAEVPHMRPVQHTTHTSPVELVAAGAAFVEPVRLMHRTAFADRIDVIERAAEPGAWVADTTANRLGVGAGDAIGIRSSRGAVSMPIAAVYRDLATGGAPPTDWCLQRNLIVPIGAFSDQIPPPLVFLDHDALLDAATRLETQLSVTWELPLDQRGLTLAQAQRTVASLDALPAGALHHEAFDFVAGDSAVRRPSTELDFIVERATAVTTAVRGAVSPVSLAGTLVALAMVASAGSYWVDRRRQEVTLLAARGVGRPAVAAKALLEMIIPAIAGGVLGWAAAIAAVRVLGPHPQLGRDAPVDALRRAGLALAVALVVLGLLVAARTGTAERTRAGNGRVGRLVPWEITLLAAAGWALVRLRASGPPVAEGAGVPPVDVLLLAFPLLLLAGGTALAMRLAGASMPWLRRRSRGWRPSAFLGVQRVTAGRHAAVLLAAAASLSTGVLVYAATLTGSVAASFDAKAGVYVGSAVGVSLVEEIALPPALAGRATVVFRTEASSRDGQDINVLAVDPATFADAAFWDRSFSSQSLPELMRAIETTQGTDGPVPAIIAGAAAPAPEQLIFEGRDGPTQDLRVVGRATTFPGLRGREPLVVVDRRAIPESVKDREPLLWADATAEEVGEVLRDTDARARFIRTTGEILDAPLFYTVIWTFGLLQALGVLAAVITVGGLVLHLETRQRARVASYGLARRMGMTRRAHLRSVAIELSASIATGWVVGTLLALLTARLVYRSLDPAALVPPAALFRVPGLVIAGGATATAAVILLGAVVAQRAADRTPLAEVMRLGG